MISWITHFAAVCTPEGNFFGFPTWYKYLEGQSADAIGVTGTCAPVLNGLTDIGLIVAAVIEILLRLAALLAIGYVLTGGIQFITAQGEPEKVAHARKTVINALIGLAISVSAGAIVSFIAGSFK